MSRIDELIAEHCPEGVEFMELQELFITRNGYTPSTTNKSYWDDGTVPWFRMEDIRENGHVLSESMQKISEEAVKGGRLFPANSIIIATSATIGEHALITVPHLSNQRFTSLALKGEFAEQMDIRFVYYYCFVLDNWCQNNTTTSSFSSVDMTGFKKFRFPIPPLEVQREIVKVLDTFTKLEAELEAELEARRRQYQYYRDALLSFDERTGAQASKQLYRWMILGEICQINRGRVMSKDYLRGHSGAYPVYSSQTASEGVFGFIDTFDYDFESITWTTDGANAGSVFYHRDKKFSITNVCGLLKVMDDSQVNAKYLYYLLGQVAQQHVSSGMGNPKLMSNTMSRIKIPVPPLEEQTRIVAILDKFDALVNDLSSGLPAELKARRQQYEHYRDRLLTFREFPSCGGVAGEA